MAWIYILIASVFEISWAIGLKYSDGLSKVGPTIFTVITMILSFYFLALGVKEIPIGTGYAVWTGIGVVGTAILGMILFGESKELVRIFFIMLIIGGIVGLRLTTK
ncbi:MAG: multidrug efflux SMR transporter [Ignavibacteriae bacterium]|nr:multidrug efflux SMR transporter [Ignavibacteriota bacterium]